MRLNADLVYNQVNTRPTVNPSIFVSIIEQFPISNSFTNYARVDALYKKYGRAFVNAGIDFIRGSTKSRRSRKSKLEDAPTSQLHFLFEHTDFSFWLAFASFYATDCWTLHTAIVESARDIDFNQFKTSMFSFKSARAVAEWALICRKLSSFAEEHVLSIRDSKKQHKHSAVSIVFSNLRDYPRIASTVLKTFSVVDYKTFSTPADNSYFAYEMLLMVDKAVLAAFEESRRFFFAGVKSDQYSRLLSTEINNHLRDEHFASEISAIQKKYGTKPTGTALIDMEKEISAFISRNVVPLARAHVRSRAVSAAGAHRRAQRIHIRKNQRDAKITEMNMDDDVVDDEPAFPQMLAELIKTGADLAVVLVRATDYVFKLLGYAKDAIVEGSEKFLEVSKYVLRLVGLYLTIKYLKQGDTAVAMTIFGIMAVELIVSNSASITTFIQKFTTGFANPNETILINSNDHAVGVVNIPVGSFDNTLAIAGFEIIHSENNMRINLEARQVFIDTRILINSSATYMSSRTLSALMRHVQSFNAQPQGVGDDVFGFGTILSVVGMAAAMWSNKHVTDWISFGRLASASLSVGKLLNTGFDFVKAGISMICLELFDKDPINVLATNKQIASKVIATELTKFDITDYTSYPVFVSLYEDAIDRQEDYAKYVSPTARLAYAAALNKRYNDYAECKAALKSSSIRAQPFSFFLPGAAGTGKTHLMNYLARAYVNTVNKTGLPAESLIWARNPNADFDDGYHNGKLIAMCDEMFSIQDKDMKLRACERWLSWVNTCESLAVKADLKDKESTRITVDGVFGSSNAKTLPDGLCEDARAMYRRMDFVGNIVKTVGPQTTYKYQIRSSYPIEFWKKLEDTAKQIDGFTDSTGTGIQLFHYEGDNIMGKHYFVELLNRDTILGAIIHRRNMYVKKFTETLNSIPNPGGKINGLTTEQICDLEFKPTPVAEQPSINRDPIVKDVSFAKPMVVKVGKIDCNPLVLNFDKPHPARDDAVNIHTFYSIAVAQQYKQNREYEHYHFGDNVWYCWNNPHNENVYVIDQKTNTVYGRYDPEQNQYYYTEFATDYPFDRTDPQKSGTKSKPVAFRIDGNRSNKNANDLEDLVDNDAFKEAESVYVPSITYFGTPRDFLWLKYLHQQGVRIMTSPFTKVFGVVAGLLVAVGSFIAIKTMFGKVREEDEDFPILNSHVPINITTAGHFQRRNRIQKPTEQAHAKKNSNSKDNYVAFKNGPKLDAALAKPQSIGQTECSAKGDLPSREWLFLNGSTKFADYEKIPVGGFWITNNVYFTNYHNFEGLVPSTLLMYIPSLSKDTKQGWHAPRLIHDPETDVCLLQFDDIQPRKAIKRSKFSEASTDYSGKHAYFVPHGRSGQTTIMSLVRVQIIEQLTKHYDKYATFTYSVSMAGARGYCGNLYYDENGKIIGMHSAGTDGGRVCRSYAMVLDTDFYDFLIQLLHNVDVDTSVVEVDDEEDAFPQADVRYSDNIIGAEIFNSIEWVDPVWYEDTGYKVVGQLPPKYLVSQPNKTALKESVLHGIFGLPTQTPAKQHPSQIPLRMKKANRADYQGPTVTDYIGGITCEGILPEAGLLYKDFIREYPPKSGTPTILPLDQAVATLPGVSKLSTKTATGLPFCYQKGFSGSNATKKGDLIEFDEFGALVRIHPTLRTAFAQHLEMLKTERVTTLYRVFLKDETLPIKWIDSQGRDRTAEVYRRDEQGIPQPWFFGLDDGGHAVPTPKTTRIVQAEDVTATCTGRALLHDFLALFDDIEKLVSLGFNSNGTDARTILEDFRKFSNKIFCGDYEGYDMNLRRVVGNTTRYIILRWYSESGASEEHLWQIYHRLQENIDPLMVVGLLVLQNCMNPSGSFITTVWNCICNFVMLKTATGRYLKEEAASDYSGVSTSFKSEASRTYVRGCSLSMIYAALKLKAYGDDHIFSANKDGHFELDPIKLCDKMYELFGIVITNTDKNGRPRLLELDEISYLGRSFSRADEYLVPLKIDTVINILYWSKADEDFISNIRSFELELSQFPEDYYEQIRRQFNLHPAVINLGFYLRPYRHVFLERIAEWKAPVVGARIGIEASRQRFKPFAVEDDGLLACSQGWREPIHAHSELMFNQTGDNSYLFPATCFFKHGPEHCLYPDNPLSYPNQTSISYILPAAPIIIEGPIFDFTSLLWLIYFIGFYYSNCYLKPKLFKRMIFALFLAFGVIPYNVYFMKHFLYFLFAVEGAWAAIIYDYYLYRFCICILFAVIGFPNPVNRVKFMCSVAAIINMKFILFVYPYVLNWFRLPPGFEVKDILVEQQNFFAFQQVWDLVFYWCLTVLSLVDRLDALIQAVRELPDIWFIRWRTFIKILRFVEFHSHLICLPFTRFMQLTDIVIYVFRRIRYPFATIHYHRHYLYNTTHISEYRPADIINEFYHDGYDAAGTPPPVGVDGIRINGQWYAHDFVFKTQLRDWLQRPFNLRLSNYFRHVKSLAFNYWFILLLILLWSIPAATALPLGRTDLRVCHLNHSYLTNFTDSIAINSSTTVCEFAPPAKLTSAKPKAVTKAVTTTMPMSYTEDLPECPHNLPPFQWEIKKLPPRIPLYQAQVFSSDTGAYTILKNFTVVAQLQTIAQVDLNTKNHLLYTWDSIDVTLELNRPISSSGTLVMYTTDTCQPLPTDGDFSQYNHVMTFKESSSVTLHLPWNSLRPVNCRGSSDVINNHEQYNVIIQVLNPFSSVDTNITSTNYNVYFTINGFKVAVPTGNVQNAFPNVLWPYQEADLLTTAAQCAVMEQFNSCSAPMGFVKKGQYPPVNNLTNFQTLRDSLNMWNKECTYATSWTAEVTEAVKIYPFTSNLTVQPNRDWHSQINPFAIPSFGMRASMAKTNSVSQTYTPEQVRPSPQGIDTLTSETIYPQLYFVPNEINQNHPLHTVANLFTKKKGDLVMRFVFKDLQVRTIVENVGPETTVTQNFTPWRGKIVATPYAAGSWESKRNNSVIINYPDETVLDLYVPDDIPLDWEPIAANYGPSPPAQWMGEALNYIEYPTTAVTTHEKTFPNGRALGWFFIHFIHENNENTPSLIDYSSTVQTVVPDSGPIYPTDLVFEVWSRVADGYMANGLELPKFRSLSIPYLPPFDPALNNKKHKLVSFPQRSNTPSDDDGFIAVKQSGLVDGADEAGPEGLVEARIDRDFADYGIMEYLSHHSTVPSAEAVAKATDVTVARADNPTSAVDETIDGAEKVATGIVHGVGGWLKGKAKSFGSAIASAFSSPWQAAKSFFGFSSPIDQAIASPIWNALTYLQSNEVNAPIRVHGNLADTGLLTVSPLSTCLMARNKGDPLSTANLITRPMDLFDYAITDTTQYSTFVYTFDPREPDPGETYDSYNSYIFSKYNRSAASASLLLCFSSSSLYIVDLSVWLIPNVAGQGSVTDLSGPCASGIHRHDFQIKGDSTAKYDLPYFHMLPTAGGLWGTLVIQAKAITPGAKVYVNGFIQTADNAILYEPNGKNVNYTPT